MKQTANSGSYQWLCMKGAQEENGILSRSIAMKKRTSYKAGARLKENIGVFFRRFASDFPRGDFGLPAFSYGDVACLAASMRRRFLDCGLKADDSVCLITEHRPTIAAAVLSSICGGPRLVLPHSVVGAVTANMMPSGVRFIVTTQKDLAAPKFCRVIQCGGLEGTNERLEAVRPFEDTILYLHTGGTSRKPLIFAKSVVNLFGEALFLRDLFGIKSSDVFVAAVPSFHIYGLLFSVLLPMVSGASVAVRTPFFPKEISATIESLGATIFVAAPLHYKTLAETEFVNVGLRMAFSSGGSLNPFHGMKFARGSGIGVTEIYGSTESGGVAWRRCGVKNPGRWKPFNVVELKVSPGSRLALTSPFLSPGLELDRGGHFRTGDVIEKVGSASFSLKGRVDDVVKIGGNRVNLAEVEAAIKAIPFVRDAWVMAIPENTGRENTIAAIVVGSGTFGEVKRILASRLKPAAVPRIIKFVPHLPATAMGKRDRVAAIRLLGH